MIFVGVIVFLVVVAFVAAGIGVYATKPRLSVKQQALIQHARYTARAARASRRGKEGEANVWAEAARDLWIQFESHPLPPRTTREEVEAKIPAHLLERARAARAQGR